MRALRDPDSALVKDRFFYDAITGMLVWKDSPSVSKSWSTRWAGKPAGTIAVSAKGHRKYISVVLNRKAYRAHRLVWILAYGVPPNGDVDHIDGNGTNNRLDNLRDVDRSENNRNAARAENNLSGITGVYWHKGAKKWCVQAKLRGTMYYGGLFTDLTEAATASKQLRDRLGFHPNHGLSRDTRTRNLPNEEGPFGP